jgi:hypothetical protein
VVLNLVRVDIRLEARLGRVASETDTSRSHVGSSALLVLPLGPLGSCKEVIAVVIELEEKLWNHHLDGEECSVHAVLLTRAMAWSLCYVRY